MVRSRCAPHDSTKSKRKDSQYMLLKCDIIQMCGDHRGIRNQSCIYEGLVGRLPSRLLGIVSSESLIILSGICRHKLKCTTL